MRAPNIIIHGIKDNDGSTENDKTFLKSFFDVIGIVAEPKKIVRLGKPEINKTRPLKVVMNTSSEKINVMSNLTRLKNADVVFKQLRITDDYTQTEREEIRLWNENANVENIKEGENRDFTFKVR